MVIYVVGFLFHFDVTTIFAYIYISVGVYKNVFSVTVEQQVKNMVAVEICDSAPTGCSNGTTLHLAVVAWVYAVHECAYFNCLCHIQVFTLYTLYLLPLKYEPSESSHATTMLTNIPMAPKSRKLASVYSLMQNTTTSPATKPASAA